METQTISKLNLHPDVKAKVESKKWFYTDTVKDHFFNPRNILINESESHEYEKNADGIGMVGSAACGDSMKMWIKVDKENDKIEEMRWQTFGCLKEGELVSSNPDFIKVEDVKMGEKIFDHTGKEAYVVETSKRKINGFLYKIIPLISKFNTLNLTEEHPILAIKRNELVGSRKQSHTKYLRVDNNILIKTKPKFCLAKYLNPGDYLVYKSPVKIKDIEEIRETELKLLGFYLSEGYFSAKEKSSGQYGIVAFAFNKNETNYIKELKNLLKKKFGKMPSERIRDNVSETYLCSRKAIRFFNRYCGHMAKNKKLHPDLIYLPLNKQKTLLNYYFKGDGHLYKDKRKNRQDQLIMSTASEKLSLQLQQLIARQGFFATISKRKTVPSNINGRLIPSKTCYVVSYIKSKKKKSFAKKSRNYFLVPIQSIIKEKYNGYVYNFEVGGKNKSYLIKGFAVHNCASALASTSMLSVMVTENGGMKIDDALKLKPQDIIARLGNLPSRKFHCSVLGDKALRSAINDYFRRSGQTNRIIVEGARIIDPETKTTDKDIEEAILEGALTLEDVQKKLKVGISNKAVIPAVEELIRFYKEKYFG
ncbi:iron-sulfur cluster assembly scaffold protein [Candidatus Woesearchaeota archaeon]|nr:iron-sulfur cluster assembly scaffold protein [Candidatus Woesearchaeota archaeon]